MSLSELEHELSAAAERIPVSVPEGRLAVARHVRRVRVRRGVGIGLGAILVLLGGSTLLRSAPTSVTTTASQPSEGTTTADDALASDPRAIATAAREGKLLVFLEIDATPAQLDTIRSRLAGHPDSQRVDFMDRAAAYEEFRALFADDEDLLTKTDPDQLPESYRVTPTAASRASSIAASVRGLAGVKELVCPGSKACAGSTR